MNLQAVRRAACGCWVQEDVEDNALVDGRPVHLCSNHLPPRPMVRVEMKALCPETSKVAVVVPSEAAEPEDAVSEPQGPPGGPYDAGRLAALSGKERSVPKGMHGRSADGREFLRGYDEVKGGATTSDSGGG